jgi:aminopeptidase N
MQKLKFYLLMIVVFSILSSCVTQSLEEGVTLDLARKRKAQISNIHYALNFSIPSSKSDSIKGNVIVSFNINSKEDVILDFRGEKHMVKSVLQEGKAIDYRFGYGHVLIPKHNINKGENKFTIEFISGNGSLNRSDEFLYTLLVPDRASTVFPCFDQPDMKAVFELSLDVPMNWTAISNGKQIGSSNISDKQKRLQFSETKPISTYLFAFAVGLFEEVSQTVDNKTFTLLHRETDKEKLERNLPIIFDLHAKSLSWLEDYTAIPYPFEKLDFILIPGFQYSGMEHPGAIFYRDSRLLLDKNPSVNQKLRQANLIAHEVAHQWFGNLVTMQWFNDVWLKEVFAGYMADMMINPQYPEINHDLSFLLSHFPSAFSVDRTKGANPIVQDLDNMLFAGTLYGDIIYHKAPIMMQQLVLVMGADAFKVGVREYLHEFYMSNANWSELVSILDKYTDIDLISWAEVWTMKTGIPSITYSFNSANESLELVSNSSAPLPPMWLDITDVDNVDISKNVWVNTLPSTVNVSDIGSHENNFMVNAMGLGYGIFAPDSVGLRLLMNSINGLDNAVARASFQISTFELFLDGKIKNEDYINFLLHCIEVESESQIRVFLLNSLETVYWRFTSQHQREELALSVENVLWKLMNGKLPRDQKNSVFSSLTSIFLSNKSFSKLYSIWSDNLLLNEPLLENQRTNLAYELMIRKPEMYHIIALGEVERINNPDRIAKFEFTLGAVSPNLSQRIQFFESLSKASNRKPEPWVSDALRLLNHPLRSDFSLRFIPSALDMLPEIQQTGDIFFPKAWLDATLSGHSSPEAYEIVTTWMKNNPTLSPNLKMKLLQSADMLIRVNSLK